MSDVMPQWLYERIPLDRRIASAAVWEWHWTHPHYAAAMYLMLRPVAGAWPLLRGDVRA